MTDEYEGLFRDEEEYQMAEIKARDTHESHLDRLAASHDELLDVLVECEEFIEGYVDVRDGDDGVPRPNRAMSLMTLIQEAIAHAKAVNGGSE